ncbi:MAG: hypothetical protein E4H33_04440, partial [Anaerolineales bacterium]
MKTLALLILTILPLSMIGCSRDQSGSLPDSGVKTPTLEQLGEDIPEGNRSFVDSGQRLGNGRSWDVALGDLDGDNDLDALVANGAVGMIRSQVWLNDGRGFFAAFGEPLGYGTGLDLGDLDGDGDLDAALV